MSRGSARQLVLLEAKASQTVYPEAARNMLSLAGSIGRRTTECIVVHAASKSAPSGKALIEGAQAMAIGPMLETLRGGHRP